MTDDWVREVSGVSEFEELGVVVGSLLTRLISCSRVLVGFRVLRGIEGAEEFGGPEGGLFDLRRAYHWAQSDMVSVTV